MLASSHAHRVEALLQGELAEKRWSVKCGTQGPGAGCLGPEGLGAPMVGTPILPSPGGTADMPGHPQNHPRPSRWGQRGLPQTAPPSFLPCGRCHVLGFTGIEFPLGFLWQQLHRSISGRTWLCRRCPGGRASRGPRPGADVLHLFQMPPPPIIPPVAPLAAVDSLPSALPDLPAASGPAVPPPSQYFSPAVILPSLPLSAAGPLPASPALPLQTVKLPHTAGAPLAMPCQTIVPNVAATATAIPLLAVAPQGVATLSIHPAVAQLPAQPVYQAAFPQMVPSDVPPSPLHTAQTVQAAPLQPAPPVLPQPCLPSVTHLPEPAAVPPVGSQVMPARRACCPALGDPVVPKLQRARGSTPSWLEGGSRWGQASRQLCPQAGLSSWVSAASSHSQHLAEARGSTVGAVATCGFPTLLCHGTCPHLVGPGSLL